MGFFQKWYRFVLKEAWYFIQEILHKTYFWSISLDFVPLPNFNITLTHLQERHWKAIFVGMNEPFDPNREFTVSDLLAYDLEQHSELIHQVYLGAIAEYDLELRINQISKFWEEQEFKLAKHIPDSVITSKGEIDASFLPYSPLPPPFAKQDYCNYPPFPSLCKGR